MTTRVLLVEDDTDLQEFMRFVLEQEKYQVLSATDGLSALEMARKERPDIILLDVLLPKMHGYEVCDKLRQDPATCLIPIMMVTSLTAIKDRLTGIKLGADEYVSKPFEPVELLARMERLLSRVRQNLAANPLTGLAGNVALEQELHRRITDKESFSLCLADVNRFRNYNERYGFERGDGVLRLFATVLRSATVELGNRNDLVAHLGQDDFAIVSTPTRGEVVSIRVLENTEELILLQYDENERTQGHSMVRDKNDRETSVPFLSMAIGMVDVMPGLYQHQAQVFDRARTALQEAKAKGGNQLVRVS
ncbi:MAG TPA: response regulator [Elusimicrobiota bacterium]|nr:response regulator [Elusimicrobiota bacterium]